MSNSNLSSSTTRDAFLAAALDDFGYKCNAGQNEFRLYHCTKQGENRFALYFSSYKQKDNGPCYLDVDINEVDINPRKVSVEGHFEGGKFIRHIIPNLDQDRDVVQKVCDILNAHPVNSSAAT